MKRIYIAGPYTNGDVAINVKTAIDAAEALTAKGWAPFVPHLTHFWHMLHPHEYQFWIRQDLEWLKVCDALVRLPGESAGADTEVLFAQSRHIPVYYGTQDVPDITKPGTWPEQK